MTRPVELLRQNSTAPPRFRLIAPQYTGAWNSTKRIKRPMRTA
ncbi:hypothetical protein [Micromonospora parastrephiae]|nr:hypothetical protein [Micromonospora parastrephiae]